MITGNKSYVKNRAYKVVGPTSDKKRLLQKVKLSDILPFSFLNSCSKDCTVGENIIATIKMRNNFCYHLI